MDPRKARLVYAAHDFDLAGALSGLDRVTSSARAGRPIAPLSCSDLQGQALGEAACLQVLARISPEAIHAVSTEVGCGRKAAERTCRTISLLDDIDTINVVLEHRGGTSGPITEIRVFYDLPLDPII